MFKPCTSIWIALFPAVAIAKSDSNDAQSDKQQGQFSLLGGPAYMPETGFMLAIGGLFTFKPTQNDSSQRSSVTLVAIANELEDGVGIGLRSKQKLYFSDDSWRYFGQLSMGRQNTHFWGLGYDQGRAVGQTDENGYEYDFITYNAEFAFNLVSEWYLGPALRLKYHKADEATVSGSVRDDVDFSEAQKTPLVLGFGAQLQWDSRDIAVNASRGQFFSLDVIKYHPNFGSDSEFVSTDVEYRAYWTPRKGSTFAMKHRLSSNDGDTPYYALPSFGGQDSMRGLYYGQYKDNASVEHTVEWRQNLGFGNHHSKHGVVAWYGLGSIASEVAQLYQDTLFSYGIGYRYEIQPSMNVRVDLGFGSNDAAGVYLSFTEAF